ncbi:MAG: hopanoid biosynthesis associated radical SAM protein HpnJ [Magnetospirillum sp.]|nr:hopanoid biosynthesis associated radical SAM protein HpnJ [Magnetospirillum sp.]MBI3708010.1 hopanoid biosynthesis associated radical SAM protein HpnJ [Pseudomonadota bacterium]
MKKSLFLNPPSYEGFDGGAGARYQAKREVKSNWYPTWLGQLAALVPDSKLVDAPASGKTLDDVLPLAKDFELLVIYASAATYMSEIKVAEAFKAANPKIVIGMVGAHVATVPEPSLMASTAIDFVARNEFDYTIVEVAEGKPFAEIDGLTFRGEDGKPVHTKDRALIHDMDALPYVSPVYRRDLNVDDYFIGYIKHPYMSFYTGRGCKSKCSFCLWPQTIGGRVYRARSAASVIEEVKQARALFPEVKEFFFDDDTFTDDLERVEEIAKGIGGLGIPWSCNAKANIPRKTLEVLKANGLRVLLVGYESGVQEILNNIRKGLRLDIVRKFAADCHELGIIVHGTFILGLPGETRETIKQTLAFAKEINPRTLQVSMAAPYPGTELYEQAIANGWFKQEKELVIDHGWQVAALNYPDLSSEEIFKGVADFYKAFYFRPSKIGEILLEMIQDWDMMKRRLREGVEFFQFLRTRDRANAC